MSLFSKSEISSIWPASLAVQSGFSWTWLKPKLLVFSSEGSIYVTVFQWIMLCNKKCYDYTCINTFAGICNITDNVHNKSCRRTA